MLRVKVIWQESNVIQVFTLQVNVTVNYINSKEHLQLLYSIKPREHWNFNAPSCSKSLGTLLDSAENFTTS